MKRCIVENLNFTSAATEFRCGGRFYFTVFRSLSTNPKVKELLKLVHICQSYRKIKVAPFYGPRRVMGLSYSEDRVIVAWVILTQCQRVTDGQTDRRTDGFTIATSTALCISYADAVQIWWRSSRSRVFKWCARLPEFICRWWSSVHAGAPCTACTSWQLMLIQNCILRDRCVTVHRNSRTGFSFVVLSILIAIYYCSLLADCSR